MGGGGSVSVLSAPCYRASVRLGVPHLRGMCVWYACVVRVCVCVCVCEACLSLDFMCVCVCVCERVCVEGVCVRACVCERCVSVWARACVCAPLQDLSSCR